MTFSLPICWVCGKPIDYTYDTILVRWANGLPEYAHPIHVVEGEAPASA